MALYNLIGHRHCSGDGRKTARKCFTASVLVLTYDFFFKVLIKTNVNINNELNFSDVYRSANYLGLLAKFT